MLRMASSLYCAYPHFDWDIVAPLYALVKRSVQKDKCQRPAETLGFLRVKYYKQEYCLDILVVICRKILHK